MQHKIKRSPMMIKLILIGFLLSLVVNLQAALTIESWRNDDLSIWENKIIPAFNKKYPKISVKFSPSPPTEYNSALNARLNGGTAGDLITCRPFDVSLELYNQGYLLSLNDISGMGNFDAVAKSAWTTDDGKVTFCLPMASVIHGFIYNKDLFKKAGVKVPQTESDFFKVLKTLQDKKITPLAMGTKDQWEAATMGFQNIGPNYWKGEEGRTGLIKGSQKLTDKAYVDTLEALGKWKPYMPRGYQAQSYPDSQNQFILGRAAIYPAGSWEIAQFSKDADFELGAFYPPPKKKGDTCYISDHTDIGLGINANSKNMAEAKTFVEWMTTKEFSEIFANEAPGFFPLSKHKIKLENKLAQEFIDWRGKCKSTIRNSYQILSRGTPNLENELWAVSAGVINGTLSAKEGAKRLQSGLASWYKPQK